MRLILLIGTIFLSHPFMAQTIEKFSIDNGGGIFSNQDIQVLSSIGEVYVNEVIVSDISISGGFINPMIESTLSYNRVLESNIFIYPNPAKNIIFISGNLSDIRSIDVYSSLGQHLQIIETNFNKIDLSKLKSGIYFIVFRTNNSSKTCKIIKE